MVGHFDPSAVLQQALAQHRSGDVAGAAALYRQLLPHLPDDPLLFLVLGTALGQLGQCEESVVWLGRSLGLAPDQPMALSNRGNALRLLKRHEEALADYDRAIALSPAYAEAHFNRGIALADLKRLGEAVTSFTRAVAIAPDYAEAYFNRGNAFVELRRTAEALADFDRAIALNPRHAEACHNRASTLSELGRTDEAIVSFGRAAAINPGYADAHNNRGCALEKIGRLSEALAAYERAIALDPGRAEAHYNRGCVLTKLDRYEEALASYDRAIAVKPEFADAYCNRGCVLKYLGQFDQAIASFTRAIAMNPNQADAHLNLATLALALGDFERGWREYEWRWKSTHTPQRDFSQPMWVGGQDLAGKTLLVHTEQGFGDMVFSCRYIPMAAALGAKVVVEGPKRLLPLLKTLRGEYTFIETGEPLPPFDLHCPIMSLPLAFNTRLESIPADMPCLFADPDKLSAVSRESEKVPRIGLVWSGNREHIGDATRSIALRQLEPILRLPFAFHALQIEIRPEDFAALPEFPRLELHLHDQDGFLDAAALIAAMDLVVTVDTVIAHVAGALGKPVWILLPWLADWRWLLDRNDSPWYPTARLFRQPARRDWDSVIAEVCAQLQAGWA
jgi:tetratricopeptide (TPR) repeat protein